MDEIIKELQKLGFSQYECKAYIGLLKHSPVTGYEVSKQTGVPRSMIYEVLGKLMDKEQYILYLLNQLNMYQYQLPN